MQNSFQFTLTNNRVKQIHLLANILLAANGGIFFFFAMQLAATQWAFITGAVAIITALASFLYKKKAELVNTVGMAIVCIGWLKLNYWWIAIVLLVLIFLSKQAIKTRTIVFEKDSVSVSPPFAQNYTWQDFQNIVLKDGLLTLDFTTNKLLQVNILTEISAPQEAEFNDFCQKNLKNSQV
ncbi:MAG: hypothetical protein MUE72_10975 [Chitinophagaceae bacterium]|nr:hypothetical protein [Chitinophagaceae bacterium]